MIRETIRIILRFFCREETVSLFVCELLYVLYCSANPYHLLTFAKFCVARLAQRRQFEPAVDGVFWRTTVFFVLVLRQQDCVLQPCISPKYTIHGRRFLNCYFANAKAVEWVVAVATAIETNARIHKIAVIETGSNWRRWASYSIRNVTTNMSHSTIYLYMIS